MSGVTSHAIKTGLLEPLMDARAANLDQDALIFDPSPETDSIAEIVRDLRREHPAAAATLDELVKLLARLRRSNSLEGLFEKAAASTADRLAADLRREETQTPPTRRPPLAAKAIARELRPALRAIAAPSSTDWLGYVDAVRRIDLVLDRVPPSRLFTKALRHELGGERFRLLVTLIERRPNETSGGPKATARDHEVKARDRAQRT